MRALTTRGSVVDLPEPSPAEGELLVEAVALGVCGTDREVLAGRIGRPPPDRNWYVLGHESLGRVVRAPEGSGFAPGDLVTGIVRRPDPLPCPLCAVGRFDLCENGRYAERGIQGLDGYGAQRFPLEPEYAVGVADALGGLGVLVEPTSVVAKAWQRIDHVVQRPLRRALVLGAGPIGLLAALLGVQRGLEVHVVDRVVGGPKQRQARALGAEYHASPEGLGRFDAVLECTGVLVPEAVEHTAAAGGAVLIGHGGGSRTLDLAAFNDDLLGGNKAVLGSVNSRREHFAAAHDALCAADPDWLAGLVTCTVPLEQWGVAFETGPDDIKSIITFG
ncbi:alcohol dehydrogenase catalytic domain-containing protein [Saccharopolyspora cebuensis]|uniref:Alcohol dehydrogenase catalytic domain-containing protein n=1 Tax=Saccharopolyspora cebuensis TaxID=418759 RepID=A0ABV4CGP1_9PSEU